jgi:hypothetical protein
MEITIAAPSPGSIYLNPQNMKHLNLRDSLEFVFRIYVFAFLSLYALGKLRGGQFYTPESIPAEVFNSTLGTASNFDLAWTFMGRSYGYVLFIGISQLVGSVLLLFNRTKLLGVAILLPIMVNIIVFDIFFLDAYGALASACIYFSMLLGILYLNKEKVLSAVQALISFPRREKPSWQAILFKVGISLTLFAVIFLLDQLIVNSLGHGKG